MTYSKFIFQAEQLVVKQLDNGTWYLEPEWKDVICREVESDLSNIEDNYLEDWWDIENVLRLEVERRNAQDSKKNDVIEWVYNVIHATVEPALQDEENDYLKNVIEYMKLNHDLEKKKNPSI